MKSYRFNYHEIILFLIFFLLIAQPNKINSHLALFPSDKKINLIFRFDDLVDTSNESVEGQILNICKSNNIPLNIAIVPFNCNNSLRNKPIYSELIELAKNQPLEFLLHGYCHTGLLNMEIKCFPYSEFYGLSFETQKCEISYAKQILEDNLKRNITGFVPPVNTYDINTLRALNESGFETISAAGSCSVENEKNLFPDINFVHYNSRIWELKDLISQIILNKDNIKCSTICVMFHPFEFEKSSSSGKPLYTIEQFRQLCNWINQNPNIKAFTFTEYVDYLKTNPNSKFDGF